MRARFCCIVAVGLALPGANLPAQENVNANPGGRAFQRDLLRELVEINSTAAFGSTKAAEAMAARLRTAGFPESDMILAGPSADKQNLVVRLRGKGNGKPILLIGHLDVVDAPKEGWAAGLDPFRLTERDGFFYGRGVLDMKSGVAALVNTLIRLRGEGFVPHRDIVIALTADEEGGNANGANWLVTDHRDWIDAAYCLNLDAGGGQTEKGRRLRMTVQTSEKPTSASACRPGAKAATVHCLSRRTPSTSWPRAWRGSPSMTRHSVSTRPRALTSTVWRRGRPVPRRQT